MRGIDDVLAAQHRQASDGTPRVAQPAHGEGVHTDARGEGRHHGANALQRPQDGAGHAGTRGAGLGHEGAQELDVRRRSGGALRTAQPGELAVALRELAVAGGAADDAGDGRVLHGSIQHPQRRLHGLHRATRDVVAALEAAARLQRRAHELQQHERAAGRRRPAPLRL